jgi:hypothetical protein
MGARGEEGEKWNSVKKERGTWNTVKNEKGRERCCNITSAVARL